jgi:very-short-patch-repair endonuclease
VLLRLDALAGNDYQATRSELEALVDRVGLTPPPTVAGWRDVLDLLNGVVATIEAFGEEIFTHDLDMLCFATGNRSWRRQHSGSGGFWQRRAAIKQFRQTARNGPRNRAELHQALVAGAQQRDRWRKLSGGTSGPSAAAGLEHAVRDYQQLRDNLAAIAACASIPDLDQHSALEVEATVSRLNADRDTLRQIPDINQLSDRLSGVGLTALLDDLARRNADAVASAGILRWVWLSSLLDEFRMQSGHLRGFTGTQQSRVAAEYRHADTRHRETAAPRVRRQVARHLREARDAHPEQSQLVRDQAARKRRHMAMRQLIEKAPDVMLAARPCWAMSPMIVSRMLPARQLFDMVIFDEASQVEPQDAVPSIMRGRQLVVAGDPKQLPPTPYFRRALAGALDPGDDDSIDSDADLAIYESILEGLQAVIPHRSQLRWHYRSRDERLIAFSNSEIYGSSLTTFPSTATQAPLLLSVVNGIAPPGQGGSAPEEVREVVRQVLRHAELHSDEGLGVITMGQRHADRIEMALRDARRDQPELDDFFSDERGPRFRFFIKSLENVQGDERDAIILSIGYAKTAAGTLPLRFGALTREDGNRRLNVAITRARRRLVVVSSFHPSELSPQRLQAARHGGTELLRRYMEYVQTSRIDRGPAAESVLLNGFERSVLNALEKEGLPVWPQWGVAGYRIDFVLAHPTRPGEMILAVETDGERYHRAASARDRDRLRQEHLERLGWRFHRLWSSDWLRDPQAETEKIIRAWRKAAEDADRGHETSARESMAVNMTSSDSGYVASPDRAPRPWIASYSKISEYSNDQLISLCLWLLSDQRQLPRDERVTQAMTELGFRRRGSIITERLNQALESAQTIFDRRGS